MVWSSLAPGGSTWTAPTSSAQSVSPPNSAEIGGTADLVHEHSFAGGKLTYTAQQFIPDGGTGQNFFLLLNEYADGGPYDWSVQLNCDMDAGQIVSDFGGGAATPIVWHQWVELRFEIDLDANTIDEYYDGNLLASHQWDDDGSNTLAVTDLFGNGASPIYYDNINIIPEPTTLVMLLGLGVLGAMALARRGRK